ncbi:MAG: hypothetical protein Q4E73_01395 [Lachnospiraceae bacterium]|nr:hypothetical protein [Lachnospiraceae bacterium]
MKNNERWSIAMFIIIFILAVCEFIILPDGIGIRLGDGLKHYCRIKPYEIIVPVLISGFGAGLVHHGTIRKGIIFFLIGIIIFIATFIYQL